MGKDKPRQVHQTIRGIPVDPVGNLILAVSFWLSMVALACVALAVVFGLCCGGMFRGW